MKFSIEGPTHYKEIIDADWVSVFCGEVAFYKGENHDGSPKLVQVIKGRNLTVAESFDYSFDEVQ